MSTWLKLLPLELLEIEEFVDPNYPIDEKNDHRVGIASDDLKRLFTLWRLTAKKAAELEVEVKFHGKNPVDDPEIYELKAKASAISSIFWIGVHDEFGLWDKTVGIRAGFVVVWFEPKPDDGLPPFLRGIIFGGQ